MPTKQSKLEDDTQPICFPISAVEINGDSALDLISTCLPLVEGIFNDFKDRINSKSSRVTAVGAGALTNFQRHSHSQEEVLKKVLDRIELTVAAKGSLFKRHAEAIEAENFMARLLDCLQNEDIVDIDNDILGRRSVSVNEEDLQTVNDIINFINWKQKFGELQAAFTKGYKMLDEHLQRLRDQQKSIEQACATAKSTVPSAPQAGPIMGTQFIPWTGPVASKAIPRVAPKRRSTTSAGAPAYKRKKYADCLPIIQVTTEESSYTSPLNTKGGMAPPKQPEHSPRASGQKLDAHNLQGTWAPAATGPMVYADPSRAHKRPRLSQLPDQSQVHAHQLAMENFAPLYGQPIIGAAPDSNPVDTGQTMVGLSSQIDQSGSHDEHGLTFPNLYESSAPTFQAGWAQPTASISGVSMDNNPAETQSMVDFLGCIPEDIFNFPSTASTYLIPDLSLYNPVDTNTQQTIGGEQPFIQVAPMGGEGAYSQVQTAQGIAPDANSSDTVPSQDTNWMQVPLDIPQVAQFQEFDPSFMDGLDANADAPSDDYTWPIPRPEIFYNQFDAQGAFGQQQQFVQGLSGGTNALHQGNAQPFAGMPTSGGPFEDQAQQPFGEYETLSNQAPNGGIDQSSSPWDFPWLR
ncbi:hypothetical protein TWF506_007205 [Arthrobotrys conoides]|uniref:Uncharacterized protein n=1 Tax=Arthrobotrys conoides TaxID=74498 RepID=A0AAN8RSK9_9PEZI